jgi:group I intron endonuclease
MTNIEKVGRIYKIVNITNNNYYIGSTTQPLNDRFNNHKYKSKKEQNIPLYKDMSEYGIDKFVIETIEEYIGDKNGLKCKEQQYIEELKPQYNTYRAFGCDKEKYKQYNKEYKKKHKYEINQYMKQWREKNKNEINQYMKQWREKNKNDIKQQNKGYHKK